MKKISISDCTLNQVSGEKPVTFREKTNIARGMDALGVDAIELAPIRNKREDTIVYRTIAAAVKRASLCIPAGMSAESAADAWDAVKEAQSPCLQVVIPTSTVQMEYLCHLKGAKMLDFIEKLCTECRKLCSTVEFVACDASRADREFLSMAVRKAEECGVSYITVCDDAGIMLPGEFAEMVSDLRKACSIPLYVKTSDAVSMAAACAVSAIKAGADGVKTSLEDGCLSVEVLADIIKARGEDLEISCGLAMTEIHSRVSDIITGQTPIMPAGSSSADRSSVMKLDPESSIRDITEAARKLGYELSEEDNGLVYEEFRRVSAKKPYMGAKELEAIIASTAMQVPSTYHLDSYVSSSGNVITAMANVTLVKDGETLSGVSTGDGPIDASFLAIEQIIGHHYELDDFQIQAVTQGREAMGSALVKLRSDGKLYSGNGISMDIIGASIRAYINALNKIVYEEN